MSRINLDELAARVQIGELLNKLDLRQQELDKNKKTWIYVALGVLGTLAIIGIVYKLIKKSGCCDDCDCNEYYEEGLDDEFEDDFEEDFEANDDSSELESE